jgi:hypothetical protein
VRAIPAIVVVRLADCC